MTICLLRTVFSYHVFGGGNVFKYSADCLLLSVNKLMKPSSDGAERTFGGYEMASVTLLNAVDTINTIGMNAMDA